MFYFKVWKTVSESYPAYNSIIRQAKRVHSHNGEGRILQKNQILVSTDINKKIINRFLKAPQWQWNEVLTGSSWSSNASGELSCSRAICSSSFFKHFWVNSLWKATRSTSLEKQKWINNLEQSTPLLFETRHWLLLTSFKFDVWYIAHHISIH